MTRDKKLAVLHQLSQESQPISLLELIQKLGEGYVERSVRRWLAEMIKEGRIEKIGHKRNTKYQVVGPIHENKNQKSETNSWFGSESAKVIGTVRRPVYERMPVTYSDEWLDAYEPNVSFYIPSDMRKQLYQTGKRSNNEDPAGTYAHKIYNRLLIDLSYNSSRLEGNTYSLLDTQRLLLDGESAIGKLDEEKIMILNHKEAIRYLVDSAHKLEITKETICTVHYLLSDGLLEPRYTGKLRDHAVRIGGSTYIPFENPKQLEKKLEIIVKKAAMIHDPFELSLFLLIHITYLQAFSDVNKRTARLSANIPLIKENFVPLSFNDIERDDYNSAIIAVYEFQNTRPLLELYFFSYMRTSALYDSTIKSIGFDAIRVRYRKERRSLVRNIVLKQLVGPAIDEYIRSQGAGEIREQERQAFVEDVLEDLKEIDKSRIASLGITHEDLEAWLRLNRP